MNKVKVSMKDMRDNYYVIGIPYCKAQYLLSYQNPVAYSSGVYGWNCDYYDIDNVVISTGYRYVNNKRTAYDYDLLKGYDNEARKIVGDYDLDYDERKKQVNILLSEFIHCAKFNYYSRFRELLQI